LIINRFSRVFLLQQQKRSQFLNAMILATALTINTQTALTVLILG